MPTWSVCRPPHVNPPLSIADPPVGAGISVTTDNLLSRIKDKKIRVGVIGLGYVGLPLAVEFAKAGFDVTGFDVDQSKADQVNKGKTYIPDVEPQEIERAVSA